MRQTCPVKSLTLVVLGWDWVHFCPEIPPKCCQGGKCLFLLRLLPLFGTMRKVHLNKLQPESCPCIQESISKKNHENRAKNGKFFTVELAQKASQPLKFSPLVPLCGTEKKNFLLQIYRKRRSCSPASFPAMHDENGQQNGKFFTVASAQLLLIHIRRMTHFFGSEDIWDYTVVNTDFIFCHPVLMKLRRTSEDFSSVFGARLMKMIAIVTISGSMMAHTPPRCPEWQKYHF